MKRILIFGATSLIAQEAAKVFAQARASFFLVGRNADKLAAIKDDLLSRGAAQVDVLPADLTVIDRHQELFGAALRRLGQIDACLIAHGDNGNQQEGERNPQEALRTLTTNAASAISLATILSNYLQQQGSGCLAVISSPAGDRGRKSNYIYGAAKATVSVFLEGLCHRFYGIPIRILTIKPGLVRTPMLPQALHRHPLAAHPRDVGRAIARAMQTGRGVVYVPWFWGPIMGIIKALPEPVFERLNF